MGAGWEEFVEKGRRAEEQQGEGAEVEIGVLGLALLPALVAVEGEVVQVEIALAGILHEAEEGAVHAEVVAIVGEVVVAGEGGVRFEVVMAIQPGFSAGEERIYRGTGRCVATDGQFLRDGISVGGG